jgi:hypothetical protein
MPSGLADRFGQVAPGLAELAAEAAATWEAGADHWTEARTAAFLQERKMKHLRGEAAADRVFEHSAVPDSLPAMEAAQARMAKAGRVNKGLISQLVNEYSRSDELEKALATLQFGRDNSDFAVNLVNLDNLVKALVRGGRWSEAHDLIQATLEEGTGQVFASTFANVLEAAAEAGEHQAVLDMVTGTPPQRFLNSRNSNAVAVCHVYQQAGLEAELVAAKEALLATGWAEATDGRLHGSIIHSLLDRGDMAGVMEEVEKVAQEHRFIPAKQLVTKKLIELEDLGRLQKMLDLSIPLMGEEKSLYDLILSFLDLGRKVQAKKLLETPGLRYNQPSFTFMANKFRKQGNIEALTNLVTLSKGIFGCDRDFLYQQLVEACSQDAARVEDLWMEIQEEGHAPSDSLKLTIATALKEGGREVPFEVPVEYVRTMMEDQTVVVPEKEKTPQPRGRAVRPKQVDQEPRKTENEPAVVQEIIALIEKKDFDSATKLIEEGLADKTLFKSLNKVLAIFGKADRTAAIPATVIAQNLSSEDLPHDLPRSAIRDHTRVMMIKLTEQGGIGACRQLFDALSETSQKNLSMSLANCTKLNYIRNDESAFLAVVQADPTGQDPTTWMISNQQLRAAGPSLLAALEVAATEGNTAAKVLLCKAADGRGDQAALERTWRALDGSVETLSAVRLSSLDFLPEAERTELFQRALAEPSKLTVDMLVRYTKAATKAGTSLNLTDLSTDTLEALAKTRDLGGKARKVLDSRQGSTKS